MLTTASAAAAKIPPPPPKFWSVQRCERVLPEQHPAILQLICVGSGDGSTCQWASSRRVRRYSELTVFAWYRHAHFTSLGMKDLEPGVVRSFTLSTRARLGFARIVHHYGDAYLGWPADFYMGHVRLIGTHVGTARFTALVAPLAAEIANQEQAVNCTAG